MSPARKHVDIHTDGACLGNPGPGGWAALLRWRGIERELAGGEIGVGKPELLLPVDGHQQRPGLGSCIGQQFERVGDHAVIGEKR